jgi:hypothetical protein
MSSPIPFMAEDERGVGHAKEWVQILSENISPSQGESGGVFCRQVRVITQRAFSRARL